MRLLNTYKNLSNWKLFFITAFVIKIAMLSYIITLAHNWNDIVLQPDDGSYFSPVDNFLSTHCYCYLQNLPFAGRMPGYSIIYLAFRLVLQPNSAVMAMVLFQFLFSCISSYALCLVAYKVFNSVRVALITFFLYCINPFPGIFDLYIVAEGLSASVFIITLYYLFKAFESSKSRNKYLFLSGLFLTWAIFLRPYIGIFILIIPFFIIYKLYAAKAASLKNLLLGLSFFSIPFILCESGWVYRNYNATHRIILLEDDMPLAYGKLYHAPWLAVDNLVFTWGEDAANFDEGSPGSYFRNTEDKKFKGFPARIFHNITTYNKDSLLHLKQMYIKYTASNDTNVSNALSAPIIRLSNLYKEDYISHNGLAYYGSKPFKCLRRLFLSGGYRYIQFQGGTVTVLQKLTKFLSSLLYFFILSLGLTGCLWCFIKRVALPYLILFNTLSITLVFTIIFYSEIQEPRYFVDAFILLVPYAAYVLNKIILDKTD